MGKKLMVKTSRNKRKSLRMLYNPSLLNFINKEELHHGEVKKEKMKQTRMSCNRKDSIIKKRRFFKTVISLFPFGQFDIKSGSNLVFSKIVFVFSIYIIMDRKSTSKIVIRHEKNCVIHRSMMC